MRYYFPVINLNTKRGVFSLNTPFREKIHQFYHPEYANVYYDFKLQLLKLIFIKEPHKYSFKLSVNKNSQYRICGINNITKYIKSGYYCVHQDVIVNNNTYYIDLNQQDIYNSYFVLPEDTDFKIVEPNTRINSSPNIVRVYTINSPNRKQKKTYCLLMHKNIIKKLIDLDSSTLKNSNIIMRYDDSIGKIVISFKELIGCQITYSPSDSCFKTWIYSHNYPVICDLLQVPTTNSTLYIKVVPHPTKKYTLVLEESIDKTELYQSR